MSPAGLKPPRGIRKKFPILKIRDKGFGGQKIGLWESTNSRNIPNKSTILISKMFHLFLERGRGVAYPKFLAV